MTDAINVIHQDHLNFDRLLTILENTVRGFAESYGPEDRKPNLDLLFTIVYYIRTFPDSIHHPKEEKYLFPALKKRSPEAEDLIARLEQQHDVGAQKIRDLCAALEHFDKNFPEGLDDLRKAAEEYAIFQREHIGLEERELLPKARACLTSSDWVAINRAFADSSHPVLGENLEVGFQMLFNRAVSDN